VTVRVVSLVPSASETLVALGVAPIACTRFCELDGVPTIGGTKRPDVDAIVALAPDVVVVNDEENRRQDADALVAAGVELHSMSPRSVADVGAAVRALADRVDAVWPAAFGVDAWNEWLAATRAETKWHAFVPVWRRPWMSMAADTYGASLLDLLGVADVFGDAADRYPEITLADVKARAPDLALLPSEPYAFGPEHAAELEVEVPTCRAVLVDGRDLFWWGIRTPVAATRLAFLVRHLGDVD
jgi:ABC-type Fe3+-hydroxamate transport system substrate-binding protein